MLLKGRKEVRNMLVTARQAKHLFCPFQYCDPRDEEIHCEAYRCMAWRVERPDPKDCDEDIGYCGLAGRPEV